MENEKLTREQLIAEYKTDVDKLLKYIPWLQSKTGKEVSGIYSGDGLNKSSISVPVYDGTLLNFVKEAKNTNLMDHNYVYIYSRYRIADSKDELYYIEHTKLHEIAILKGILSKYVLKGMTKSTMWTAGVESQVFLQILLKLKELMEFVDQPLA